ncbi:MAG: restriction endonuclease subunit S [Muribaculaceae bacterium]|nr:restriction endonuclease subunit S [Muribaculaceae bacterium]
MKSNYKRLGDLINTVSVKNTDMITDDLRGVNYQKYFMPSVANTIGVDLSGYKVIKNGQFACNLMHVGRDECLPIALHRDEKPIIVSPAYFSFEVKDESEILSEFLFLWFKRAEFDREACFYTDADVRQGLIKSSFFDMKIPVPPIEEQRKIVAEYQAVERRIENNRRLIATLEATAQTIYRKMFVDNIDPNNLPQGWRMGTIGDLGRIVTGKTPSSSCPEDFGNYMEFITPGEFKDENIYLNSATRKLSVEGVNKLNSKILPQNSIAVTCIGYVGKVCVVDKEAISNQQINTIIPHDEYSYTYVYFCVKDKASELQSIAVGASTLPMLSKKEFEQVNIPIPSIKKLKVFWSATNDIFKLSLALHNENNLLDQILNLLLLQLSNY